MHTAPHALIGAAARLPICASSPVLSFSPVVLSHCDRPVPLELRATFPSTGDALPIILLSHGQGRSNALSSLEGYAPLAEFWAAHGFAVLQPTHLSSKYLSLTPPEGEELFYQQRSADFVRILDQLDTIENAVPGLKGRLDATKVAIAGHSAGGWTASMLLGASNKDPRNGPDDQFFWYKPESRIKAGVVLAGIGSAAEISESGKKLVPFYGADFGTMGTPALVVYGDEDVSPHLTTGGPEWHAGPYELAPGSKDLLILKGAKHGLGGVSGWDVAETQDESPERLGIVQRMTWAYLRSQLFEGDNSWDEACKAFEGMEGQGKVESKR